MRAPRAAHRFPTRALTYPSPPRPKNRTIPAVCLTDGTCRLRPFRPNDTPMVNSERLRELAISDAGFVFDPLTGHTYNVNATALAALRALKEGASPEAVIATLSSEFEADPEQDIARDVYELLSRLREHGLVK